MILDKRFLRNFLPVLKYSVHFGLHFSVGILLYSSQKNKNNTKTPFMVHESYPRAETSVWSPIKFSEVAKGMGKYALERLR